MDDFSTSPAYQWTFRRAMGATLILILIFLSFWLFYRFYKVAFILFFAILISMVTRPVVNWLNRRRVPQFAGVILVYLLLIALLIGMGFLLIPRIVEQGIVISEEVSDYYQNLREWITNNPNTWFIYLGNLLPARLPGLVEPVQQTGQQILVFAENAVGYLTSAANFIIVVTAVLLLAFHWTLAGPQTIQSLLLLVPKDRRNTINELIKAVEVKVGFYIIGQSILCLIIGTMALIAYLLIGLPGALVLALTAGIMEAVPFVGPFIGAIPAALVALAIAPSKLIWVIIATLVIQQVENIFLVPRVMRKTVGVNPFVSLLAIYAFSALFGIAGALIAIPLAAIIQLLLDRFVFHPSTLEPEVSDDRDLASRLRYEAQELVKDLRKQARLKKWGSDLTVKQIDQVMDEIEGITTDLDAMLAQKHVAGVP